MCKHFCVQVPQGRDKGKSKGGDWSLFPVKFPLPFLFLPQHEHHLQSHPGLSAAEHHVPSLGVGEKPQEHGHCLSSSRKAENQSSSLSLGRPHAGNISIFKSLSLCEWVWGHLTRNKAEQHIWVNHPLVQELPPNHPQVKTTPAEKCISTSIYFNSIYQVYLKN